MKRIRQYNDFTVRWSLVKKETQEPFILEGMEVTLVLKNLFMRKELTDFTIQGNMIEWEFKGKDQTQLGVHTLTLTAVGSSMVTTDACDFVEIVDCDCMVGGYDPAGVETATIELTSKIEVGASGGGGSSYDDTEIRTELSRLDAVKAEKAELTELSSQVSGLSERIEDLEQGGSSVFEATYGETQYADIVEAVKAKKHVICFYNDRVYNLCNYKEGQDAYFSCALSAIYTVMCTASNKWSQSQYNYEITANKVTKIDASSTDLKFPSAKAVYDAIQQSGGGGSSSDKQGVIRQTQKWTQAADNGYDYVMQNIVRGAIPQANLDLFVSAGAVFNEESGYFELNGLTDISYEEMVRIYSDTKSFVRQAEIKGAFALSKARTNFPIYDAQHNAYGNGLSFNPSFLELAINSDMECFAFFSNDIKESDYIKQRINVAAFTMFLNLCQKIKKVIGYINAINVNNAYEAFTSCYSLEDIYILNLKIGVDFKRSSRLSNVSILYMIKNAAATSPIVITLHPDAKARAEADAEIMAALNENTNVTLGV